MRVHTLITGVAASAILAGPSTAQQEQAAEPTQVREQTQIAEQCYEDLRSFGEQVEEDGYWLTGVRDRWGAGRWGGTAPGTGYYPGVGVPPAATGTGMPDATVPGTAQPADTTRTGQVAPVWGLGVNAPGVQIEVLSRAAEVLAMRGDEEGCNAVLNELTQVYDEYVGTLQEAGVEPGEVTVWRQEMIVAAQPVEELDAGRISIDEVTGTEVRNLQDEHLGEIDDVLISDGQIEYAIVSRGGFLGIGEDYVAVPWEAFSATPNLNLFLLDVPEAALEQAPAVSGDALELTEGQRSEVSEFWQ